MATLAGEVRFCAFGDSEYCGEYLVLEAHGGTGPDFALASIPNSPARFVRE